MEARKIVLMNLFAGQQWRHGHSSVQLLSRVQLCDPMNCSTPGLPVPSPTPGAYPNPCPMSQ